MQSLLALAVLATIIAQANPNPATSPGAAGGPDWTSVVVQKCTMLAKGYRGFAGRGIEITFVNNAKVSATQVTFHVSYHGQAATIPDRGSFTPGTVIKHDFLDQYVGTTLTSTTPEVCRVGSVTFADGTTSTAPAQPGASPT
jgi:hypothetical protein